MIFFSKRHSGQGRTSNMEACVSILGLFLAIGLIGGLSALIYGLIKGNFSGTIGGAVVLGVSVFLSIILALVFMCCLKKNDVDANANERRSHTNRTHHERQNRHGRHEQTSSHEISVIPGVHRYDQRQPNGLADSTNSGYGQQIPRSLSKPSSFSHLNQSNGSIQNQDYRASISLNTRRSNQN